MRNRIIPRYRTEKENNSASVALSRLLSVERLVLLSGFTRQRSTVDHWSKEERYKDFLFRPVKSGVHPLKRVYWMRYIFPRLTRRTARIFNSWFLIARPSKIDECSGCRWRNFCGAGCMGNAFEANGIYLEYRVL